MTCKKEWKQGRDRTTIYVVIESCKVHPYIVCAFMSYSCPKRICRDVLCTWFNYHVYCSTIPTLFPFFFARHPYIIIYIILTVLAIVSSLLFGLTSFGTHEVLHDNSEYYQTEWEGDMAVYICSVTTPQQDTHTNFANSTVQAFIL